jgi:MSHA biogenesis protein MshI
LRNWLARDKKMQGWLAASPDGNVLAYAHGQYALPGRSSIKVYGTRPVGDEKQGLQKAANELHFDRYQCSTLLRPGDYQLLLVEALNVPKAELKSAMRWRVKDMIDYHIDDATIDVLDIPSEASGVSRGHMMYAICARNDTIQACIKTFQDARIPLSVIDIPETAQRNLAALYEEEGRGLALVYFGEDWGLLTINFGGELFLARRMEIGLKQLAAPNDLARQDALDRVALELQRTFDHFDRQFHHVPVGKLLVAPMPQDLGLKELLAKNVTLQVEDMDLRGKLEFGPAEPDAATQWRLFHHFGAALRHEARVL